MRSETPRNVDEDDRSASNSRAPRSEVMASNGMVATSQPLATEVGLDILRSGGSAVDAAIAANAMLALVEPTGAGLGGDLFAIVWSANERELAGLNASGRSPRGLSLDVLRAQGGRIPSLGPLSVSVPGCVDGWYELHRRFGTKSMPELLAPAIRRAHEGFSVTEVITREWESNARVLMRFPNFASQFMPGGRAPARGDVFRNPNLGATLERIALEGRDGFYRGEIATAIGECVRAQGGFLDAEDLGRHASEWVEPVSLNYRGYDVWELPPNGQGIAALEMLGILEGFDLASMGFGSADYLHHLIEAKKLAFEDRARLYADMEFARVPVQALISKEYASARRERIDPARAADRYPVGDPALDVGDTVYLTVADAAGNVVSLIQSNYEGMGSGVAPPGLGLVLQNRGALFDLAPGRANTFAPGKRPFHTIIPSFVTRGGVPWLSFGVMGGGFQPQGHVQILANLIDFGMNAQAAGDAPRVAHFGSSEPTGEAMADGGSISLEAGIQASVRDELTRRGHVIRDRSGVYGGYQAIRIAHDPRVYSGASESRKDGIAAGY